MTDSAVPPSGVTTPPTDALSNENDYTRLLAVAEHREPPRLNDEIIVQGVVRTVETLFPPGHYRITLDVILDPDAATPPAKGDR